MQIPRNFQPIFDRTQIQGAVDAVGHSISTWAAEVWQNSHTDIIAIPVLRGGIFFFADVVRAIQASVEIAPAQARSYTVGVNEEQMESVDVRIENVPAAGRSVLLLDDVCDSGRTLEAMEAALLKAGAREVKSAVLIKRELAHRTFEPSFVGLRYNGPEWFVGYGMEDAERWRNLPDIYVIRQS